MASQPGSDVDREAIIAATARGAVSAVEGSGLDPTAVHEFINRYFRHVDAGELRGRSVDDLIGLVASHFDLAKNRTPGSPRVRVCAPEAERDGWSVGSSVIQIVNDDQPFLVDTVSMELLRQGWNIREIFHPQFLLRREIDGMFAGLITQSEAETDPLALAESWIHVEAEPPSDERPRTAVNDDLEAGLRRVLTNVAEAVEDWAKMRGKVAETVALVETAKLPYSTEERAEAVELLNWVADGNFTFLGYREYRYTTDGGTPRYESAVGTGLGILRADQQDKAAFDALPPADERPSLVVVSKDNVRSPVHRPAYLDYIGVRVFNNVGQVVGERRFLGLFAVTAYSESVVAIPPLRAKAEAILSRSGYAADSHGAKAIQAVIENYPRDELFQTSAEELAPMVEQISRLKERRQVRMFVRRDEYGRFLSCLVFLPRDRYTTQVRRKMEDVLMAKLEGASVEYQTRVTESVLARLHFIVRMPSEHPLERIDVPALEQELTRASRSWDDDFADELGNSSVELGSLATVAAALPEGYKENFEARHAMMDLQELCKLGTDDDAMSEVLYVPNDPSDEAHMRLKVFRIGESMSLSDVLPHLSLLGVKVIDERPYEFTLPGGGSRALIYDFGLHIPGGRDALERWTAAARTRFTEAFEASYRAYAEADALNGLVMSAGLTWRQVAWLRTVSRYLRQGGLTYSQTYIARALNDNVAITRQLVRLFETKFDPGAFSTMDERRVASTDVAEKITATLDDVASLDHDRIMRLFLSVINATVRTNAFRPGAQAIAIKLLPREMKHLPEPRPAFEVFVYSPRVEGVHLRYGLVARGGLRWSDRAEDFRTEILGLVKAQMVKNTVIVPVGAKGGFYPKQLPDPAKDRNAWFDEGKACYRVFINSLLDVTDNLVGGEVERPDHTVCFDGDDPYLVVAADKGTATFSDTANEISAGRGFWLGDAFASGGSVGYDHKGMGITAKGAWCSVQRHFREMGIDCQSEDFTCVGIGDMGGDVFGNGMLLSKHTKLVAAFNHLHIFIDPDPDPAASWDERKRMFALPRSTWADYNTELISKGGGVFERTAKSIKLNAQIRKALGIDDSVKSLAPTELITAILKAPVDLIWNGGIGTYVKASTETHAQVGDKTNDVVRVNATDLRCKAIGEGGNLGLTQLGRIEYARAGGRINTDFIDNSAGVDTSDHEVNIKILLANEVEAGRLSDEGRVEILRDMTDEVADLVLAHNYDQNIALANGMHQAAQLAGVHERWMAQLERLGYLDREIECMPDSAEMARRIKHGEGLHGPELATLMAWTKIMLEDEILDTDLPDDPYLADRLIGYFPVPLRDKYKDVMPRHRLQRDIITTVAVNRFVNSSGTSCYYRMSDEANAKPADVIRAQLAARSIFKCGLYEVQIKRLDNRMDAEIQTEMRIEIRNMVERGTRWVLHNRRAPIDVQAAIDQFTDGVQQVCRNLADLLTTREREEFEKRRDRYREAGVAEDLATFVAGAVFLHQGLGIVANAQQADRDVLTVAATHFGLAQLLCLDRVRQRIADLPRLDEWEAKARGALRDDLQQVHAQLTAEVLAVPASAGSTDPEQMVRTWVDESIGDIDAEVDTLMRISDGEPDLARLSVGLRLVRSMLQTPA